LKAVVSPKDKSELGQKLLYTHCYYIFFYAVLQTAGQIKEGEKSLHIPPAKTDLRGFRRLAERQPDRF
jgi:hypothetical protein